MPLGKFFISRLSRQFASVFRGLGSLSSFLHGAQFVIDRHERDLVHALVLDGIGVQENAWQMPLVAGSVRPGHREQGDFLALDDIVGGLDRGPSAVITRKLGFPASFPDF